MIEGQIVIVGGGVSGLSLARRLKLDGRPARLLEKSRGVGGRCATRRVEGLPVDHGVPLLHGRSDAFLDAMAALNACRPIRDWPYHVQGAGTPCQPQAYHSFSFRLGVEEGVNAFPRQLARGLDVELRTRVSAIARDEDGWRLTCEGADGPTERRACTLVLTAPVPQTIELLRPLAADSREVEGVVELLRRIFVLPCLTVLAGYELPPEPPQWHLHLPGPGSILHTVINDSSKRPGADQLVLVHQATPEFSREHLEDPPEQWSAALLEQAARSIGAWAGAPRWQHSHRWAYARLQRGDELARPVLLSWPGGQRLGLCGEAFNPAGGVEGAYLSGIKLAERIIDDAATDAAQPA